jgi:nucleotide-binding universal stress UspA family protein
MKPERILVPLDIRKCPLEVFSVVNGLVSHPGDTVILLHVVTLNIAAPENRVYEEHGRDAHWYLERLARGCLRPDITTSIRVRVGNPAEEIVAEAAAVKADLIVLPSQPPSFWRRVFGPILPRLTERVVREAPCRVLLASAPGRFDCEDAWGRAGSRLHGSSRNWERPLTSKASPMPQPEEAFASAQESHCATT